MLINVLIGLIFRILVMEIPTGSNEWGFSAHQKINRMAVFTLPPEMITFYKYHIQYITEKAVNPDLRRYVDPEEAARHYIDLDVYGDSALQCMPRYYSEAVAIYSEDSLKAYGILPWRIYTMKNYLTKAFMERDANQILRLSTDIGHYIGDAHVPLHTTQNYNGQLTDQHGIHGFWESRLPELFSEEFDYFIGKANYIEKPQLTIWNIISGSFLALDSVLKFEKILSERFEVSSKYSFEERGTTTVKVYSYEFSKAYYRRLDGMVERQMRSAIKMIGDFWYTCWVDGGQPDLTALIDSSPLDSVKFSVPANFRFRNHESEITN